MTGSEVGGARSPQIGEAAPWKNSRSVKTESAAAPPSWYCLASSNRAEVFNEDALGLAKLS